MLDPSYNGPNPGDGCFFSVAQAGSNQPVLLMLVETRDKGGDQGEILAPRDPGYLDGGLYSFLDCPGALQGQCPGAPKHWEGGGKLPSKQVTKATTCP